MKADKELCVLCAWRENCNKKFSISGRDVSCPDFVKDLNIKEKTPADSEGEQEWKIIYFAAEALSG
jgi:hypothetical protein